MVALCAKCALQHERGGGAVRAEMENQTLGVLHALSQSQNLTRNNSVSPPHPTPLWKRPDRDRCIV
jgi:hypothetical protein